MSIPFDPYLASFAALLCAAAYDPALEPLAGFRLTRVHAGDEQALFGQVDGVAVLALRGTKTWRQWVANLKLRQNQVQEERSDDHGAYSVHRGFDAASLAMMSTLNRSGLSVTPGHQVMVFGHSLGGAEAKRIAWWLHKAGFPIARVVTFGDPRLLDARGAKLYNAALGNVTFSLVNNNDIVPRLPPYWLNYRHAGRMVYANRRGEYTVDCPRRPVFDQLAGRLRALGHLGTDGTEDHAMAEYHAITTRHAPYRLPSQWGRPS